MTSPDRLTERPIRRPFRVHARLLAELGAELISSDAVALYELIKNAFDAGSPWARLEIRTPVTPSALDEAIDAFTADPSLATLEASELASLVEVDTVRTLIEQALARTRLKPNELRASIESILRQAIAARSLILIEDRGSGMDRDVLEGAFLSIATPMRLLQRRAGSTRTILGSKGIGRLAAMRLGRMLRVETATAATSEVNTLLVDWTEFSVDPNALIDDVLMDLGAQPNINGFKGTRLVITGLNELWTLSKLQTEAQRSVSQLINPFARNAFGIHMFFNQVRVSVTALQEEVLRLARFRASGSVDARRIPPLELRMWHFDEPADLPLPASSFEWDRDLEEVGPFTFDIWEFDRTDKARGRKNAATIVDFCDQWGGGGPMLFRDGFRVMPYGSNGHDWLELDQRSYTGGRGVRLRTPGVVGFVTITSAANAGLVDMSNREGLRMTPTGRAFIDAAQNVAFVINQEISQLEPSRRSQPAARVARMRRGLETAIAAAAEEAAALTAATPVGSPQHDSVEQLSRTVSSVTERARAYLAVNDREGNNGQGVFQALVELAGLGMTAESVSHELLATIERAIGSLSDFADASPELRVRAGQLRAAMESIRTLVLYLDPLTQTERREVGDFDVATSLRHAAALYPDLGTTVDIDISERAPLIARMSEGALLQVFDNLVNNSIYWMRRNPRGSRRINIVVDGARSIVTLRDTGRGIDPEIGEAVFEPFVSGKPKGRGLGLYIASQLLSLEGGEISLSPPDDDGRIREFRLDLPPASPPDPGT